MSSYKNYTQANRLAWNKAMFYHRKAKDKEWDNLFSDPEGIIQKDPELSLLLSLGIKNKSIVQLCCNNGRELLSLKRLGASEIVGFDISDEAIKDAKKRSDLFKIKAEFHQSDVYSISESFYNKFDLVYITIGALTWLPDLLGFFKTVNALLKKKGKLFIYDSHPFAQVLPWKLSDEKALPVLENNYFVKGPLVYNDTLDYYGGVEYTSPVTYEFVHTLSDILNSITQNGLVISLFNEYEHDISNGLEWVDNSEIRLPLSFILVSEKVEQI